MDPRLLAVPAAFGLAGASGLNASLPLLVVSALARAGLVHLAPPFDVLGSDVAFYGLLCVAVVEFAMDKVPMLDSAGHVLMAPLAATSGAIVFASQAGTIRQVDPGFTVLLGLLMGGGTATAVHLTRATARPVANLVLLGPVVSAFEDAAAVVVVLAVLLTPLLLPLAVAGAVLLAWTVRNRRARRRAALQAWQQYRHQQWAQAWHRQAGWYQQPGWWYPPSEPAVPRPGAPPARPPQRR
jgi:hypothetical protein